MTTRSTDEAMRLLHRRRRLLIQWAQYLAAKHAKRAGTVHSRDVRTMMAAHGWLSPDAGEHWLGAVFRSSIWEWTGRYHAYSDHGRNIHERTVKVWRLRDGCDAPRPDKPPLLPAAVQQELFP